MQTIDAILTRRSTRVYTDEQVSRETVEKLLELGTHAASGSNTQPWAFAVIRDRALLDKYSREIKAEILANIQGNPHLAQYEKMLSAEKFDVFNTAPMVVCIFGNTDSAWYVNDCSMVAGNIMLAAHDLGLGTCWIGFAQERFGRADFLREQNVPEGYKLVAVLALGHPRGSLPPSERKPAQIFNWLD